jgi:uncharacterized protein (TIGR02266 family)
LADPNTRQGKRTPVTLKIKFKSETLEQFIERYAVDVSQGGIFIRTKDPLAVGTQMKFEFQLRDASPLIAGEGTVVWTRENDPSRPAIAPGMGVRFDRLGDGSQSVLEKILAEKAKQAPQRGPSEPSKPPLFTDVPTRVAPSPVQDALMGGNSGRSRADSEQTPLPKPMPFHSDADEFGAEAFEEATKVRALDELVAATANENGASEDLALRRPSGQMGVPIAVPTNANDDRDSAPALPSAPESGNTGRIGKMLDTSPSPRPQTPSSPIPPLRGSAPSVQPSAMPGMPNDKAEIGKTRLGVEPARSPRPSQRNEAIASTAEPPPERPSAAPIVIGVLVVVAAAIAALWYFVLRTPVAEEIAAHNGSANPTLGSAVTPPITNGSAIATNGSAGSAAAPAMANAVDTQIAANAPNATVTIEPSGESGAAPFKAKLEKDKSYKVRVEAPGYVTAELDVNGGQDQAAKLVAKTHVLSITSTPSGAQIIIDSSGTGRATPYDVELTAAQAAKPKLRVTLRKGGYRQNDVMVDAAAFKETDDAKHMTASVDASLSPAPVVPGVHNNNTSTGSATTTPPDAGSASTPVTSDSGSAATTPTPTPPSTSSTTGSASAEPTPDFAK